MTTTVHKNLTGADLHEPKGADTALSGMVYVANGSGSGVWTVASSVITNTAFTTGDLKPTHKSSADTGWILWSDGTIGDGSSSATIRANADTQPLFNIYYALSNTICPVSGGRGANAAADFAAHKTIAVPVAAGRVFGLSGSGSGLTARTLGSTTGAETHALTLSELPTGITSNGTGTISDSSFLKSDQVSQVAALQTGVSSLKVFLSTTNQSLISPNVNTLAATSNNTGGSVHSLMQPTAFVNVMIKL